MMNDHLSISSFIEEILSETERELVNNIPKSVSENNSVIILLFFTLYDISIDINCLAKNGRLLSIPSLVRNFMDSFVAIKLIKVDENYIYTLLGEAIDKKIKKVTKENLLLDGTNFESSEKVLEDLNSFKADIDNSKNSSNLSVFQKYEKVEMKWFYDTVYSDLCSETHNSILAIEQRHVEGFSNDKALFRLSDGFHFEDYQKHFIVFLTFFSETISIVSEMLGVNNAEIKNIVAKINLEVEKINPYVKLNSSGDA